jgi:hypothetical protein
VFTLHAVPGPLQKVGDAQVLPLQTPEQQTPPLLVAQALPVIRQVLPGPPSLFPPSSFPPSGIPPSSLLTGGFGPPQLQAANVYPITSATENANSDFLILLLRFAQPRKTNSVRCILELLGLKPAYSSALKVSEVCRLAVAFRVEKPAAADPRTTTLKLPPSRFP